MGRVYRVWIWTCPRCTDMAFRRGEVIETSSSDYPFCARCKAYGPWNPIDWEWFSVRARLLSEDECNCGEIIRHNNGGNYHYSRWQVA
jgi:hypothetical protein